MRKKTFRQIFLLVFFGAFLITCTGHKIEPISIISGIEIEVIEPFLKDFEKTFRTEVTIRYAGPGEILSILQEGALEFDVVWPVSTLWLIQGDTVSNGSYSKSIMSSPVIFGIKKGVAANLGWIDKPVSAEDLLQAARNGKFSFLMASATQTGSGGCGYLGILSALTRAEAEVSIEALHMDQIQTDVTDLLHAVERTAGSSIWLQKLMFSAQYDSMMNYEAQIFDMNNTLLAAGRDPLYLIYPADGTVSADFPLVYIDRNNRGKKQTFLKLQEFLLSDAVQNKISQLGYRTAVDKYPENSVSLPITGPKVLNEALSLYQTKFRKPSISVFCLDYSGSMRESGHINEMITTMEQLFNQEIAAQTGSQIGEDDITMILPFGLTVFDMWITEGNDQTELNSLSKKISSFTARGETDIYTAIITALDILSTVDTLPNYLPAIYLISDGTSEKGRSFSHLQKSWESYNIDVPVFTVLFDQTDEHAFEQISTLTGGRVFYMNNNPTEIIRKLKGYN